MLASFFLSAIFGCHILFAVIYVLVSDSNFLTGRIFGHILGGSAALLISLLMVAICFRTDGGRRFLGLSGAMMDDWMPLWVGIIIFTWLALTWRFGAWQGISIIGGR